LRGTVAGQLEQRYVGAVVVRSRRHAPRLVNCPFSGRPSRWAPTTTIVIDAGGGASTPDM